MIAPGHDMAVIIPRGTVVLAEVVDPQGRNPKTRPLVVIEDFDDGDDDVFCVAVTTAVPKPLPADCVNLPWHRDRRQSKTGLTAACVAVCNWVVSLDETRIEQTIGRVPDSRLAEIVERVQSLLSDDDPDQGDPGSA